MVAELYALAESGGAKLVGDAKDAEVVITAIGMRKRLERHISWDVAVSALAASFPLSEAAVAAMLVGELQLSQ